MNVGTKTAASDSKDHRLAIERIGNVVGEDNVLWTNSETEFHSRVTMPTGKQCGLVVFPASRTEVQGVVQVAGELGLSLWPCSGGFNWGYGTRTASHENAVILVLNRLNRIIDVNEDLAYAVIEPGVTQQQLNDYLKENQLRLWADCTDSTPQGSVVGNALERGVGYTPYGDHFGNLCGLEVVLPNGELLYTGGTPEQNKACHAYKWGTGPYLEGMFSQSSLGIVTRAGIWLMREPEHFEGFVFELRSERHLPAVIKTVRELSLQGVLRGNVHMINQFLMLSLTTPYPRDMLREGETRLLEPELQDLADSFHIAPWTLVSGLYGPETQVRANKRLLKRHLRHLGRLTFLPRWKMNVLKSTLDRFQTPRSGFHRKLWSMVKSLAISRAPVETLKNLPVIHDILQGIPSEQILRCAYVKNRQRPTSDDMNPARDQCGLLWYAPIVPTSPDHVSDVLNMGRRQFEEYGFDFSMSFIFVNPRSVVMLMEIFFDKDDPVEAERAQALYETLYREGCELGYQQYRTSVPNMAAFRQRLPAGNRHFLDAVKKATDPGAIISPGRYGFAPCAHD